MSREILVETGKQHPPAGLQMVVGQSDSQQRFSRSRAPVDQEAFLSFQRLQRMNLPFGHPEKTIPDRAEHTPQRRQQMDFRYDGADQDVDILRAPGRGVRE